MKHSADKEYHPVIENYISEYAEDNLDAIEKAAFEEVMVYDDDIRELATGSKEGKRMMDQLRKSMKVKARDKFLERLRQRIAEERED